MLTNLIILDYLPFRSMGLFMFLEVFFKRTFLALGIWDYSYEKRGGTSKDVDSKITHTLLIKNS